MRRHRKHTVAFASFAAACLCLAGDPVRGQPYAPPSGRAALSSSTSTSSSSSASTSNPLLLAPPPAESRDLSLNLTSGGYLNAVYRSNLTAAQVLFTAPEAASPQQPNRFLVALPAGNSGSCAFFFPAAAPATDADDADGAADADRGFTGPEGTMQRSQSGGNNLSVTLEPGSLSSALGPNGLHGVKGTMLVSGNASLNWTQIGSVRQVRDFIEGKGLSNPLFNFTVTQLDSSVVWFSRLWLNETVLPPTADGTSRMARYGYELRFEAQNGTRFEVAPGGDDGSTPPSVRIVTPSSGEPGKVDFIAQTNETALVPLRAADIFSNPAADKAGPSAEQARNATENSNAGAVAIPGFSQNDTAVFQAQMSFLLYEGKATAGGWRFLTYFGRDTLFTLHLLKSTRALSPLAIESILAGVVERINATDGRVCHEETIGDYATLVHLSEGRPERGNAPVFDYKMQDTNALITTALADYFLLYNGTFADEQNRSAQAFLDRTSAFRNNSYRALLEQNVRYMLNASRAFADEPRYERLAANQAGIPVGNWRDSNEGLGYGTRAFDVNTALWPAALHAIADLAAAGVLDGSLEADARRYAHVWEEHALRFFEVRIPAQEANDLLDDYVVAANLSQSLLYGLGSLNGTDAKSVDAPGSNGGRTSAMDASSDPAPLSGTSKIIYGLSLRENGSAVAVQHSDLGFGLAFRRNITADYIERVIEALQPYPRGLLTNVGMLVANPAYDRNRTNIGVLGRTAYHGTVSWSWQSGMMSLGLTRVLRSCNGAPNNTVLTRGLNRPEWCDDEHLVARLGQSHRNLITAINAAPQEIFGEVWTWNYSKETGKFDVVPLGAVSPTESDAIQLWSFGALNGITTAQNVTVESEEEQEEASSTEVSSGTAGAGSASSLTRAGAPAASTADRIALHSWPMHFQSPPSLSSRTGHIHHLSM